MLPSGHNCPGSCESGQAGCGATELEWRQKLGGVPTELGLKSMTRNDYFVLWRVQAPAAFVHESLFLTVSQAGLEVMKGYINIGAA